MANLNLFILPTNNDIYVYILIIFVIIIMFTLINYFRKKRIFIKLFKRTKKNNLEENYPIERDEGRKLQIKELLNRVQELQNENKELRQENSNLKERLQFYENDNEDEKKIKELVEEKTKDQGSIEIDEKETDKKFIVSYSYTDPAGTLKLDSNGDMYLIFKNDGYYELNSEKEILGTAIYLEIIQYSYKILNPRNANDKPMNIIKKPKYRLDKESGKGLLKEKGEVEYK